MTVGRDYEWYATLTGLDYPWFNEFECKLMAYFWYSGHVIGIEYGGGWGPNLDFSSSFQTPIGSMGFPVWPQYAYLLNTDIFDLLVGFHPYIGSDRVTAQVTAGGDASAYQTLTWTYQNQRIPFIVHADDYGPTDTANVVLSDFRYYLTHLQVDSSLILDFEEWIEWVTGGPYMWGLFSFNLGWIINWAYLGTHSGWDGTVDLSTFVRKYGVVLHVNPNSQNASPGEVKEYDVLVVNTGNVQDTFELSVQGIPETWGYWLNSSEITLGPYAQATAKLYVQPDIYWATPPENHQFTVTATSKQAPLEGLEVTDSKTVSLNILPFYEVDASLATAALDIVPGEQGTYDVTVTNYGNVYESIAMSVDGLPGDWSYDLTETQVGLDPGESTVVQLTVEPYRHWSTSPGEYHFSVTGTSLTASAAGQDVGDTEALVTNVLPFYDVDTSVSPESVDIVPGETGAYSVSFTNQGNVPDVFSISVGGIPSSWEYSIPEDVSLDPGQSTTVELSVEPWRHWSTSPGEYPFTVTGTSQEAANAGQSESETAGAAVNVLPFYDVSLEVTPETITMGASETAAYSLYIFNLGNVVDDFEISLDFADNGDACRAYPTVIQGGWATVDASLTLEPGASETRTLTIEIPYDWAGMEDTIYGFTATVSDVHGASAEDSAEVTVTADKESMCRYVDHEIGVLASLVEGADIADDLKESLLDKLSTASKKNGQCLDNILDGREKQADNMLKACMNVVEAFAKLAKAQKGKGIDKPLSDEWISAAEVIIGDIGETMQMPL